MEQEVNRKEIRVGTKDYERIIAIEKYAELSTLYCTVMNFHRYNNTEVKECFSKELMQSVENTLAIASTEMSKLQNKILQFPEGDFVVIVNW